jgi:hypothetical protein
MRKALSQASVFRFLLFLIAGTSAMTVLMGLFLWAISPGPAFFPLGSGALGALASAVLGLLQSKAMGSLAPKGWTYVTTAAGALGVPISIYLAFPFIYVFGEIGVAASGLILGMAIGVAQFLVLRKRYARTWPWIPLSTLALSIGFFLAFPVTTELHLRFYPPFSPGWTAVGAVAGFTYGFFTGLALTFYRFEERTEMH